jgi:CDP-paratose 2-epimerase
MKVFITGGAGFIGCNAAAYYLAQGAHVTVFDNLSRPRTRHNVDWLREQPGHERLSVIIGDIRDAAGALGAVRSTNPDLILHLAGQTAVTTSVQNPREDFEINALGTFNMLEAARAQETPPVFIYASTNKVYGGMEDVVLVEEETRYRFRDFPNGISEAQPLDFHSPYGCSKGTGDQYVRDYARIYNLPAVVMRQSTIYGLRQFGVEDQGWLAHFIIAAVTGKPIKIFGDGKQVRDMLHVRDLIAAYDAAFRNIDKTRGEVFNIGGGSGNTISIWAEAGPMLEEFAGREIPITRLEPRPGDQPCFIADHSKLTAVTGWKPRVSLTDGAAELWGWVSDNKALFA